MNTWLESLFFGWTLTGSFVDDAAVVSKYAFFLVLIAIIAMVYIK